MLLSFYQLNEERKVIMKTSVIGYPRVGSLRELKFTTEHYFKGQATVEELLAQAKQLRKTHWETQAKHNIDYISSNDFSLYDNVLDTAFLLNVIPQRYQSLPLDDTAKYFALARGYQGDKGDVKALAMKKWFNTNYHYLEPEIDDNTHIKLTGSKLFDEFKEAKALGINTKPVMIGPLTFLKLARYTGQKNIHDFIPAIAAAYKEILAQLTALNVQWVQFDEPILVTDLTEEDISLFRQLYQYILSAKGPVKVLLQTYFGDIRDCYTSVVSLPFDGIGLDFVEGKQSQALIKQHGFPTDKVLFAGVLNGKNIWRNHYRNTVQIIQDLNVTVANIVVSTSCSLLHVPYTLQNETKLSDNYKQHFSFAVEKLSELEELQVLLGEPKPTEHPYYIANSQLFAAQRSGINPAVQAKVAALSEADFVRLPVFSEREWKQKARFRLPLLPTTTIGSFPQTSDVRTNRAKFKKGEISLAEYESFNKAKIAECIALQEKIDLDVLVHGEFERNDMVEYFGENFAGYLFTEKAWVQSYGTRCVKPPIVWGDISRTKAITVAYSVYAQSLTSRPVKGMLTGPVTILNWSFPREDISLRESALQIALAIREEVLELEANGISIIQVDEAALKEKLPIRQSDWDSEYLDWAIPAFRLVHSGVKEETQIHTHMCYSQFSDIIKDIDAMDADVISFEASRSNLTIIDVLQACNFKTEVGPGVYDIHSPRIPAVDEITTALNLMLTKISKEKLWVNPDCGLKTRGDKEVAASLENLVLAAKTVRKQITG